MSIAVAASRRQVRYQVLHRTDSKTSPALIVTTASPSTMPSAMIDWSPPVASRFRLQWQPATLAVRYVPGCSCSPTTHSPSPIVNPAEGGGTYGTNREHRLLWNAASVALMSTITWPL